MKIGLQAFVTENTAGPADIARKAESVGFDSIFIPEHPIIPIQHRTRYPLGDGSIPEVYAHMPDPFRLAGARGCGDHAAQARHRDMPRSGARSDPDGEGNLESRSLFGRALSFRYRRRMARRRIGNYGRRFQAALADDSRVRRRD